MITYKHIDYDEEYIIQENSKKIDMFYNHAFEEYISDIISVNRSLPDRRDEWCKDPQNLNFPVGQ